MKKCKHCNIELPQGKRGLVCVTCKNGLDRYNMTRLDMIEMHKSQDGKCKLCDKEVNMFNKTKERGGVIDHDHETNEVRGVLCFSCNYAVGLLEKNIGFNKIRNYLAP